MACSYLEWRAEIRDLEDSVRHLEKLPELLENNSGGLIRLECEYNRVFLDLCAVLRIRDLAGRCGPQRC